ncbi:MAG: ATP-binding cassette domain-containing protein [Chitinophagales bacterium]
MSNNSNDIAIKVESLSKVYQKKNKDGRQEDFYALKDVGFEIKKGETVGIIGKNGSGKSTLLKILSGVVKPSSGNIFINGNIASILDVGTGFHPELTGRENVYLRGELLGMSHKEIDTIFNEIVEFSEIEEFIETPVKNYSSGMFLRLAFSIIIHLKSDIILLDEVMSVGDAAFKSKTTDYFNRISATKSKTILLISHSFQEIINTSTEIIELSHGKIVKQGSTNTLLEYYRNSVANYGKNNNDYKKYFEKLELNCYHNNALANNISIDKPIQLRILCHTKRDLFCHLAIKAKDVFGNVVFVTSYLLNNKNLVDKNDTNFQLSINIPAKYFNHGVFYFDIIGLDIISNEITFQYLNAGSVEFNLGVYDNLWMKKSMGPVRPFFIWEKTKL